MTHLSKELGNFARRMRSHSVTKLRAAVSASILLAACLTGAAASPVDSHYQKTCTASECHADSAGRGVVRHIPFLEETCDRCHTDHASDRPGLLIDDQPALCLQCHTDMSHDGEGPAHPPGASQCTDCHNPHESAVPHFLRSGEQQLACGECHAEDLARESAKPYAHRHFDPKRECGTCHYAHKGQPGAYLRPDVGETCLTCHDMQIKSGDRKLENVGRTIATAKNLHPPLAQQMCPTCHTPHGSDQPSLLRDSYPAGSYESYQRENYELCWQCHDPLLVEGDVTRFRNGETNLHQVHVAKFKRGRACHLCHAPHASEQSHLVRDKVMFGSWAGDMTYQATASGGNCTTACHRPKEYRRGAAAPNPKDSKPAE